jgi:MFS family permease
VTSGYRWYALGLLALINLLNYIDRNVIYALFEPIKQDLSLTDSQLGWLGSAYILVFSVAALPFGVLSDLRSRRAVIAAGVSSSASPSSAGWSRASPAVHLPRRRVGGRSTAGRVLARRIIPGPRAVAMGIPPPAWPGGYSPLGGHLESIYGWRVAL